MGTDALGKQKFSISIRSIEERDKVGQVKTSILIANVNFTRAYTNFGLNVVYNYSAVLENKALLNVIVSLFRVV